MQTSYKKITGDVKMETSTIIALLSLSIVFLIAIIVTGIAVFKEEKA